MSTGDKFEVIKKWARGIGSSARVRARRIALPVQMRVRSATTAIQRLTARVTDRPMRAFNRLPRRQRMGSGILAGLLIVGIMIPVLWLALNPLPDIRMLENYSPIEAVKIYDSRDRLVATVAGDEDRQTVKLSEVSPIMRKAMLAAEDHEFYGHSGFSVGSIIRAALKNFEAGRVVEGASTITQQLVKNLFFPGEGRSINRKVKEVILAAQVDAKYSKDQILEMYLNQIYFGNQSYGIERAAQRYFSKPASKLNLAESAFLAGVVKSPTSLSDPDNRQLAVKRQNVVLDKMVEYGFVKADEVAKAKQEKLAFRKYVSPFQKYPFYVAHVMDQLRARFDHEEIQRGLKVYTHMDQDAQIAAEQALAKGIDKAPPGVEQGALVSVRVDDGAVVALVGGVGKFEKHQWNRAVSPHTMGSSFKPFVYLTGFLNGQSPDDIVVDAPVSFPSGGQVWSPRNFEGGFMGAMTIRKALAQSRNICAAKVAHEVGIQNVIRTARMAGITSTMEPYLPISLGAAAASPLDMAGAYATFARGGLQITPQAIRRIEDNDGKVVAAFEPKPKKVFDSNAVAKLLDTMQSVVTNGTGIRARLKDRPVAGKTGTSDAARDIWFVGFTADHAVAVWGGNDYNKAIHSRSVTGGMIMAAIFKNYMDEFYKKHPTPVLAFMKPSKDAPKIALDGEAGGAQAAVPLTEEEKKAKAEADAKKKELAQASAKVRAAKAQARALERKLEQAAVVERTAEPMAGDESQAAPAAAPEPDSATAPDAPKPAATATAIDTKATALDVAPKPAPEPEVIHRVKVEAPAAAPSPAPPPAAPVPAPAPAAPVPAPAAQ